MLFLFRKGLQWVPPPGLVVEVRPKRKNTVPWPCFPLRGVDLLTSGSGFQAFPERLLVARRAGFVGVHVDRPAAERRPDTSRPKLLDKV